MPLLLLPLGLDQHFLPLLLLLPLLQLPLLTQLHLLLNVLLLLRMVVLYDALLWLVLDSLLQLPIPQLNVLSHLLKFRREVYSDH